MKDCDGIKLGSAISIQEIAFMYSSWFFCIQTQFKTFWFYISAKDIQINFSILNTNIIDLNQLQSQPIESFSWYHPLGHKSKTYYQFIR